MKTLAPITEDELATEAEDLRSEREAMEAQLTGLRRELEAEKSDLTLGYEDARLRAECVEREIEIQTRRLVDMNRRLSATQLALEGARRSRLAQEQLDRDRLVPVLAQERVELAHKAQRLASELGDAFRELELNAWRLSAALATPDARRLFSSGALRDRLVHGMHHRFDMAFPEAARKGGANLPAVSFLDLLRPTVRRPDAEDFAASEQHIVDVCVRIYASQADALAARDRIDPISGRDTLHLVGGEDGLWRLVFGRRRGRRVALPDAPDAA